MHISRGRVAFVVHVIRLGLLLLGVALLAPTTTSAQEISRQPPAVYRDVLAKLLTPLEDVLASADTLLEDKPAGAILLDETFYHVDEQGRRVIVQHSAYKTLAESGVKSNSEDIFTFRRHDQKIHVVLAETIQPDGSVLPVKPNAILLQSPQRQAEYALYDDQSEIRIIFPNVKPGSISHSIIVTEDIVPRMPGEFAQSFAFVAGWPIGRQRYLVDLPAALAERLQLHELGTGLPRVTRTTGPDGRTRFVWDDSRRAKRRYEIRRAPAWQVGPAVLVSTVRSWDDVATWYAGLLKGRDTLTPGLRAQIDDWTRDVTDRDEIIRILFAKIANDVRYVGLELGAASYQPHTCAEVWENQYGDCKDKANLLAAMLRHKGIEAHLTLLNTTDLGLIDRRSPTFRAFDHAIAAIPRPEGGYLFCDPTITEARPGLISPGDADRDVFVITAEGGKWARTPPQSAGELRYDFDLGLAANGELSGWLTLEADGYYGAGQRSRFRRRDVEEMRREMSSIVRDFFPGAEIVDVERRPGAPDDPAVRDTVRAFFVVPRGSADQPGAANLRFVFADGLLPGVGDSPARESTLFLYRDTIKVAASFKLPAGISAAELPPTFQLSSPSAVGTASWRAEAGVCRSEFVLELRQSAVRPEDFATLYRGIQSLRAWLEKPVVLRAGGELPVASATAAALDLPHMPTAEGQLDLVDRRFPTSGNRQLRRAALEETLRRFPNDKVTVARVGGRIAWLDWQDDKNQPAYDRLALIIANYRADLPPETFAWLLSLQAFTLRDLGREPDAIELFTRIAREPSFSASRRLGDAFNAADLLAPDRPADALALLTELIDLPGDSDNELYQRIARYSLRLERADTLRAALETLLRTKPDSAQNVLVAVVKNSPRWTRADEAGRATRLISLIESLAPQPGSALAEALKSTATKLADTDRDTALQARLRAELKTPVLARWYKPVEDESLDSTAAFKKAIDAANEKRQVYRCVQLSVQDLATQPVGDDFAARLWPAIKFADWQERSDGKTDDPVFTMLLSLAETLPSTHDTRLESRFLQASRLARRGDLDGEAAVYRALLAQPDFPEIYLRAAHTRLGQSLEKSGKLAAAADAYKPLEELADTSATTADTLLRAALVNLHLGRFAEALRIVGVLEKIPAPIIADAKNRSQIQELIALAKTGDAETFWRTQATWWPLWTAHVTALGLTLEQPAVFAPIIPDLTDAGRKLGVASRERKSADFFEIYLALISGARWFPSLAAEPPALASLVETVAPGKAREFRQLHIAMLSCASPTSLPSWHPRQVMLAATLIDDQQSERVLPVVAETKKSGAPASIDSTRALHRVWGVAALQTKKQLQPAADALSADLTDADYSSLRGFAVKTLADLLVALDRKDAARALLDRELANPHIRANRAEVDRLTECLKELDAAGLFNEAVARWLKQNKPAWYDFAEPASLDDPRLRDLDTAIAAAAHTLDLAEQCKFHLLVLQSEKLPAKARRAAWDRLWATFPQVMPSRAAFNGLVKRTIAYSDLDESLRVTALSEAVVHAVNTRNAADFAAWRKDPLAAKLSAPFLERAARFMAVDFADATALRAFVRSLAADPLETADLSHIRRAVATLGRLDATSALLELAAESSRWSFRPSVDIVPDQITFEIERTARRVAALRPLHEAGLKELLAAYPKPPKALPAIYADQHEFAPLTAATPADTLDACLHLAAKSAFEREDITFWSATLTAIARAERASPAPLRIARALAAAAGDDPALHVALIDAFANSFDLDDATTRASVLQLIKPWCDPVSGPQADATTRVIETILARRQGRDVDIDLALGGFTDFRTARARIILNVLQAAQRSDKLTLKAALDNLPSSFLLNPRSLPFSLPALERVGDRPAELGTARQVAQRETRRLVARSWASRDADDAILAANIADALGQPELLPAAWLADLQKQRGLPALQWQPAMIAAHTRGDAKACLAAADRLIEIWPNTYTLHFYRGAALAKLGRKADAIAALSLYTRYSGDELNFTEAKRLLATLGQ